MTFVRIEIQFANRNFFKYFVVHSAFVARLLLASEYKPDLNDSQVADGN
jgi:hypothetical protein